METLPLESRNTQTGVGKQITCPKCAEPWVLKVKEISRKATRTPYLYCYHYDPPSRKIHWCYIGKINPLE